MSLNLTHQEEMKLDQEFEDFTYEQKVVHHNYRMNLRFQMKRTVCRTISKYWSSQSDFFQRERIKSISSSKPRWRTDSIFYEHLLDVKRQENLNENGWPGYLTPEQQQEVIENYKELIEDASKKAKEQADRELGGIDYNKLHYSQ